MNQIKGLHHVTSMAKDAQVNSDFFTKVLGLRRVKKTVNFDAPDVYHLYYGDAAGSPGSVMTYFPFPNMPAGQSGTGEVGITEYAVPTGSLAFWTARLADFGVKSIARTEIFGDARLEFDGPDGERFALVETNAEDARIPWTGANIPQDVGIRGFFGARLRLRDTGPETELLRFMGYQTSETANGVTRLVMDHGNGANTIDLQSTPSLGMAHQGAGSVHHIAFAVPDRDAQLEVRNALLATGYQVTPVIDRDYFWAIYFRTPGGILFEIATNEPGFDRDEAPDHLGEALKLPTQHEKLRGQLERKLVPIVD
ncbi:ring-cleaving dioxygenase [Rhodobacteraceae bacterium SC52]|nr:ring-cleaving dioxygenase [Rhodobacteraceae bacterium SC52]